MLLTVSVLGGSQSRYLCATSVGRSAQAFCRYFRELQQEPLNPIARVVFSLALANAKAQQDCKPPLRG